MKEAGDLIQRIFSLTGDEGFEELALEVFRFQADRNEVYRQFCHALGCDPRQVKTPNDIPFLPIELFKNLKVVSFRGKEACVFTSSGTTGSIPSRHYVADLSVYERSFLSGFRQFYGEATGYAILVLLPGYLERKNASLVYMARRLIQESSHPQSGFYLNDMPGLARRLQSLQEEGVGTLLLGVSFALLDFASLHSMPLKNTIVMETGGMKGRRREMVREELHRILCTAFHQEHIHSEYGMTELLSQAYSKGDGLFACPPWMRVMIRDSNDPLELIGHGRGGGINVIDLANIHSCSFLATQDLGKTYPDGRFEVLGRFDQSDMRGCNLMAEGL